LFIFFNELLESHGDGMLDQSLYRELPFRDGSFFNMWYGTVISYVEELWGCEESFIVQVAKWCFDIERMDTS